MTCPSCGGILGRECFNPEECAWIAQRQEAEYYRQLEAEHDAEMEARFREALANGEVAA